MVDLLLGHTFGSNLDPRPAEREGLSLREQIAHQEVMVVLWPCAGTGEPDEVARDEPRALVEQLVERVLAIRAGLAPHHGARGGCHRPAVEPDRLAVALHVKLLEVRGKAAQVVRVRQHRLGLRAMDVRVPHAEQPHDDSNVLRVRHRDEVLVYRMEAREELAEPVGTDRQHHRQTNRRIDRVATTDPVPEPEHVLGVDTERADRRSISGHGHEVLAHRLIVAEPADQPIPRRPRVGQCLDSGERFRAHHEQRRLRIEACERARDISAIDV